MPRPRESWQVSILVLAALGCTGTQEPERASARGGPDLTVLPEAAGPPSQTIPSADPDSLELAVEFAARVQEGEPVVFVLRVRNVASHPVLLETGDSATTFNFRIVGERGEEVWSRLDGVGPIPAVLRWRTLAPGEEVRYSDTWNQVERRGLPVPPGTYRVQGALDTKEVEDLEAGAEPLVISGRNDRP